MPTRNVLWANCQDGQNMRSPEGISVPKKGTTRKCLLCILALFLWESPVLLAPFKLADDKNSWSKVTRARKSLSFFAFLILLFRIPPLSVFPLFLPLFGGFRGRERPFDDDNGLGRNKKTKKESKKETRKKTTFSSFWFLTADQSLIFESLGVWRSSFTIFQTSPI